VVLGMVQGGTGPCGQLYQNVRIRHARRLLGVNNGTRRESHESASRKYRPCGPEGCT
jgi:hypothetical protein